MRSPRQVRAGLSAAGAARTSVVGRARVQRIMQKMRLPAKTFAMSFTRAEELDEHLANRGVATLNKRASILAVLHAIRENAARVRVEGAKFQDGSGSSSTVMIEGKPHLSGVEYGHIAMGTYVLDGEAVTRYVWRKIKASRLDPSEIPHLVKLSGFCIALDGMTEVVPAMINRSSGVAIENPVIREIDAMRPLPATSGKGASTGTLIFELERAFDVLSTNPRTIVAAIERREEGIDSRKFSEIRQNPRDHQNRMFDGQERKFLEAAKRVFQKRQGNFAKILDMYGHDIPALADEFMEIGEYAAEDWSAVQDATETEQPD